jgi:hypothetical protein
MNASTSQPPVMASFPDSQYAAAKREASWSAVACDTAFERLIVTENLPRLRKPKSGVALRLLGCAHPSGSLRLAVSNSLRLPHALQDASRLCALLGLAMFFTACGKSPEAAKTAETPVTPKAAVPDARIEAEISSALTPAATATTSTEDEALKSEADSIIAQYPGKTATELLNTPEVKDKLAVAMNKLGNDPVLMKRVNSTVDLAAQIKGLEGAAKLDLDMKGYDQSRTSRMLQSVLSEEPQRIVDFLVSEIGEAAPDLSYGGLDRAPNGVAIVPNTLPAPAAAAAPTDPE